MRLLKLCAYALCMMGASTSAFANGKCPPIQHATSCNMLVTIQPTGRLTFQLDPSVRPYDDIEDIIVGVENKSGSKVFGISLSGSGIFEDDGDGPFGGRYPGPGTSFSPKNNDSGLVNFANGLANDGFIYFALEGAPTQIKLASTVTIDPGHGLDCVKIGQLVGAVGVTDFPPTNPPPGKLREDDLTVAISNQLQAKLAGNGYKVKMTKTSVQACPTFMERGQIAEDANSNIFVSVHVNAPGNIFTSVFQQGSFTIYNAGRSSAKTLAEKISPPVAQNLGMSDRGALVDDRDLAVLKSTTTKMVAVIVENGRLSRGDEQILHSSSAPGNSATGIAAGIDAFINQ